MDKLNKNISMTKCHKGGIKIHNADNEYKIDPFEDINNFKNTLEIKNENIIYNNSLYDTLDLNINNYSREDIFTLFGLKNIILTEAVMKNCKKIVLKTHPDKSHLHEKYFFFFSKAYKNLYSIFEFQNKTSNKITDTNEYYDSNNTSILDKVFEKNTLLKKPDNFNKWFNTQFDKHKLEDESSDSGYGSWLKSDDDIIYTPNVTKLNMGTEIEKRKKIVQSLTEYTGVNERTTSTFGGSSLMEYNKNFTSNSLFSNDGMNYTDLRQAYVESVIPITEDTYNEMIHFDTIDEIKKHRNETNLTPVTKENAIKQLFDVNQQNNEESCALAFYYAKQTEKVQQNQSNFWASLNQISN